MLPELSNVPPPPPTRYFVYVGEDWAREPCYSRCGHGEITAAPSLLPPPTGPDIDRHWPVDQLICLAQRYLRTAVISTERGDK
jgi:hypothetical protein